ncbi:MAG: membrane protein insertase YidC [Oscillospiraceae bacterium]|nr:membrane protein insertase YidC [Oscillospiraceae bacterium]
MWAAITRPFAWLMRWLYTSTGSYGLSLILFALAVNLILSPFMAKSKKSMMRTTRLQPKLQELQKKHEGNQQKLNEETQKLYREEGVNPMSGCIWTLIPFPILIALYSVIRQPLSRMMFLATESIDRIRDTLVSAGLYTIPAKADAYAEIKMTDLVTKNWDTLKDALSEIQGLIRINFNFLGLNLGERPWDQVKGILSGETPISWAVIGLVLIPLVSAALSWLTMKVSQKMNPQPAGNAQANATAQSMNLMMPIMSIWICFIMPAAMGIYWIFNSVFGMARDYILTKIYKKKLDEEDAAREAARSEREKELEEKRLETERLRAEGKTEKNVNTSKKKMQAAEKQKSDERKAALEKAEREARRKRLGIADNEIPASQVGNRRYARGRAYVPDRYTNPENAEAATLAAAEASEGVAPIDESIEDDVLVTAAETVSEALEDVEDLAEESEVSDDYLDVDLSVDLGEGDDEEAAEDEPSEDAADKASAEENGTE